jgi:GNAT superfamily N-acetyltransferase
MRRAMPADKEAVLAISRAVSADDYIPEMYDFWLGQTPPDGMYVAERDGRIVGCHAEDWPVPGEAYLYAMRIDPAVQGQGLGTAYARAQVEHTAGEGVRNIYLTSVVENHRAHRLVEKVGFVNRGEWVIYDRVAVTVPAASGRYSVRRATAADIPRVSAFREPEPLSDVIASPWSPWTTITMRPGDWSVEDLVVAEGPDGALAAVMLLRTIPEDEAIFVRRLEGEPTAGADLLACAGSEAGRLGLKRWSLSLPARWEPLLEPLGLNSADTFRAYVYHYTVNRAS